MLPLSSIFAQLTSLVGVFTSYMHLRVLDRENRLSRYAQQSHLSFPGLSFGENPPNDDASRRALCNAAKDLAIVVEGLHGKIYRWVHMVSSSSHHAIKPCQICGRHEVCE